jgi:hypothetical protein
MHRSKRASLNVTGTHVSVSADRASRLPPSLTASRQSIRAELIYIKAPWLILNSRVRWLGLTAVKGRSPRIR